MAKKKNNKIKHSAKKFKALKGTALAESELTGTIQGSGKGYAFFIPDDNSGDLFVPSGALNGAIHGDTVTAVRTGYRRGHGEAEVVKILKRGVINIVGVFDGKYVVCTERALGDVKADTHGGLVVRPGEKVVATLIKGSEPLKCKITEVLGTQGDTEADIMGIIRGANLYETFPNRVEKEAFDLPDEVEPEMITGRRDFRDDTVITIDGATSKDFDDAICVERTKKGYRLCVHIADVAEYVTECSKLDKEAAKRGTSVYFADRVLPMLPESLSNGICSLNEGVDRLTLSCIMEYNAEGEQINHTIVEGVIRSKARMTYDSAEKIIGGDSDERAKYGVIADMLDVAAELARILNAKRMARGSVEFDIEESEIIMGEGGKVVDVKKRSRLFSHKLIEEFMLAANETVAEHFQKRKVPFVYRVHEIPPAEKVESLNDFLGPLGLKIADKPKPVDYAHLIENLDESVKGVVNRVALRSMSKAAYKPECLGHFGLAAEYYCHFTSPIRRYPDLVIHRIIKYILHGGKEADKKYGEFVRYAAIVSSEREKVADDAERKVDDLLKAKFMQDKIGEEFDAVISGVTEWGLFAELPNSVEGMIRVESLPGGGYDFDPKRLLVKNQSRSFKLGDTVRIKVLAVNFDKVAFALAE